MAKKSLLANFNKNLFYSQNISLFFFLLLVDNILMNFSKYIKSLSNNKYIKEKGITNYKTILSVKK